MVSRALLLALPALAAANPAPAPEASPNPQLGNLLSALTGGLLGGGGGGGPFGGGGFGNPFFGGYDDCACQNVAVQCSGTQCECRNTQTINCWLQNRGQCEMVFQNCPATGGASGLPTAFNSEFPPCGRGLPGCASGKSCRKIDAECVDDMFSSCMGVCVPPFPAQQPVQPLPKGSQVAPPRPASNACPPEFTCTPGNVCIIDPRDQLAQVRGPTYLCISGTETCGGWRETTCPSGTQCVPDPRMVGCSGQGCTGLCA